MYVGMQLFSQRVFVISRSEVWNLELSNSCQVTCVAQLYQCSTIYKNNTTKCLYHPDVSVSIRNAAEESDAMYPGNNVAACILHQTQVHGQN